MALARVALSLWQLDLLRRALAAPSPSLQARPRLVLLAALTSRAAVLEQSLAVMPSFQVGSALGPKAQAAVSRSLLDAAQLQVVPWPCLVAVA